MYQACLDLCYLRMTPTYFLSGDDVKEISKTLSKQLDKLNSWFAVNKLSLNVSKTNYIIFGNKKIDKYMNICVRINGLSIDRVYNTNLSRGNDL